MGNRGGKSSWNKWGRWVFSASHGKQIIFTFYYLSVISCKYKTYLNHPKFLKDVLQKSFATFAIGILCSVTFDLRAAATNITLFCCCWYLRH